MSDRLQPITGFEWRELSRAIDDCFQCVVPAERCWIVRLKNGGGLVACREAADGGLPIPAVCGVIQLVTERGGFMDPEWSIRLGPGVVGMEECSWPMLHAQT